MAIVWCWYKFYVKDYNAAVATVSDEVQAILDLGFHQDGRELFLPITFDANALADGFREDDFKAALEPIVHATTIFLQSVEPFNALRAALYKQRGG